MPLRMVLPVLLLLALQTATQTEANVSNFTVDCANLLDTVSSVCDTYLQHPSDRQPRDTRAVGTSQDDSGRPVVRTHSAFPVISDIGPMLSPEAAYMLVKTQWPEGRFRRSQRSVNAYDECCSEPSKTCTLHEIAGYCATFKPPYQYLAQ